MAADASKGADTGIDKGADNGAQTAPNSVRADLTLADLRAAMAAGLGDLRAYPAYGLFFAAIYVIVGNVLAYALLGSSGRLWLLSAAAGFPLLAPFTAVGLYEVSRRREAGRRPSWRAVLGALRGHGDDQLLMMGGILFVAFSFWMILAHGIFAIFMAESGVGADTLATFTSLAGLSMLAVGSVVGALVALAFYAISVISLPMLVDREVDFLSAIIASLQCFQANRKVLLIWAMLIAIVLFVAMIPAFLGLFIALPVLGHATWHLYRRAIV